MKRYKYLPGNPGVTLFAAICDYDNIKLAHENASRGKGFYKEVQMVNKDPDKYLKHIQYLLMTHQFKTSKYEIFERNEHDKVRKIYKLPYYPDRIVQWAILQIIGPIMERNFIFDTYSSIKGRGPLLCMQRIHKAAYYHYKNNSDDMQFYLKLDVRKFYPSINHDILKQKYANLFKDDELLDLIYEIIDSVTPEEGVPIGNFLSQFSGNIYLSDFDHMMKEEWERSIRNALDPLSDLFGKTETDDIVLLTETRIYIGLNDATTKEQLFETEKYMDILKKVCQSYKVPFSVNTEEGGYYHEDGTYTEEKSFVLLLIGAERETVKDIARDLCTFFNQESVLVTENQIGGYFISRETKE